LAWLAHVCSQCWLAHTGSKILEQTRKIESKKQNKYLLFQGAGFKQTPRSALMRHKELGKISILKTRVKRDALESC